MVVNLSQQCHFMVCFLFVQKKYKGKSVPQYQHDEINKGENLHDYNTYKHSNLVNSLGICRSRARL